MPIDYSQKILSLQFSIDHLLNDKNDNLVGKKIETILIKKQCEQLLSEVEREIPVAKDAIQLQIFVQDKILIQEQMALLENFLSCLRNNRVVRETVKEETLKEECRLLGEKLKTYEKI